MSSLEPLFPLLAGISAGLSAYVVLTFVAGEERLVARRLRTMTESERAHAAEIHPLAAPFQDRVGGSATATISRIVRSQLPAAYAERVGERIRMSGARRKLTPELFVMLKLGLGLLGLMVALWLRTVTHMIPLAALVVGIIAVCIGFFGPDVSLSGAIASRQELIRLALPDLLDMLMVSVEAGLGFDASLKKVVASTTGPLSEEFAVVLQEMQGGMPRREALQHLSVRTGAPDLNAFIMAIVQADVFGVSVSQVLRAQAQDMRVRRRQRAQEAAQKAPANMVLPLIVCILPATLIVAGGPAIISIIHLFTGL